MLPSHGAMRPPATWESRRGGLEADNVTALSTVVLTGATIAYVVLTHRLSKAARESNRQAVEAARSSDEAAKAALATAQTLADATARATAIREASIDVDFHYSAVRAQGSTTVVLFKCGHASVFVSKVDVRLFVVAEPANGQEGFVREFTGSTVFKDRPVRVNQGEQFFALLKDPLPVGASVIGQALVDFGFTDRDVDRQRTVQIPTDEVRHISEGTPD